MREEIVKSLLDKVKNDYSAIAAAFSATRKNAWDEFTFFDVYLNEGDRVLDVGCGNGRLASFLERKKITYLGIDNNKEILRLARARHPGVRFRVGDQTGIPLPDASMDHIWNIAAFHHIPSVALRQKALREMKRVLRPGGYLMMTVWNLWQKKYRKYIYRSIFRNLLFGEYEYNDTFIPWGKTELIERYYHAFTMKELETFLKGAGFIIIDRFCSRRARKVPSRESYNFCFIARKP